MTSSSVIPYVKLALAMCIVGSFIVVNKVLSTTFPHFLASGIRLFIGAFILNTLLWFKEPAFPRLSKSDFLIVFVQSFVGVFLFNFFILYGLQFTSAVESGIITSTTPAVIGLLSLFFFKERLTAGQITGIILAFAGALVINVFGMFSGSAWDMSLWGNLLIFGAVIGEAVFITFGKLMTGKHSPLATAALTSTFGFFLFLPFSCYQAVYTDWASVSMTTWGLLIYTGVVVTAVGVLLLNQAMMAIPASSSAVFSALMPVSAVVLSFFLLRESIFWYHLAGILLVLAGIFATSFQFRTAPTAAEAPKQFPS